MTLPETKFHANRPRVGDRVMYRGKPHGTVSSVEGRKMPWRTITAAEYVNNSDPDGFDEARIECPDGRLREIWDAGFDDDPGVVVVHTSMAEPFAVTANALVRVR